MSKCCRKCWTPYNCGNHECHCHPVTEGIESYADQLHRQYVMDRAAEHAGNHPTWIDSEAKRKQRIR